MLSVAGAEQLDPAYNADRPKLHPQPASNFPSIKTLLPQRVKYDPELYDRVDEKYFHDGRMSRFRTADEVTPGVTFDCGDASMVLIVDTSQYDGLNTVLESDFSLMDTACTADAGYIKWESVVGEDGNAVEFLVVDIPLDACGTTAEYDAENEMVLFSNAVRNGAFSIESSDAGLHEGITIDSIVDFAVTCKYTATYDVAPISTSAEHTSLEKAINDHGNHKFALAIEFKELIAGTDPVEFQDFEGDAQYIVGDPAHFVVQMEHPNSHLYVQVEKCSMISGMSVQAEEDPALSYTIVEDQCGDPFTNAKVIDNYADGTSLISFTMFEFVADIETTVSQDNIMNCEVKLCLVSEPCPVNDNC